MAEHKLDIHQAMAALDRRDGGWFAAQSEEARKGLAPPVFIRWASTIADGQLSGDVIISINAFVNMHMWDIAGEHPEMLFRLAALCGAGKRQRHEWIAMPGRKAVTNKARSLVERFNPSASDAEIDMLLKLYTHETFASFVNDTASEDAKEILKAYDKHYSSSQNEEAKRSKRA